MSAQTLAVKYRPEKFEDVTEQGNVITILKNQLEKGEIRHAYLFDGGAGTGKTTCARIFANEINKGMGTPTELDAAKNNSVEHARAIIQQSKQKPLDGGEYRVYIIDECFPQNTSISTPQGQKSIRCIKAGDYVNSMSGVQRVTNVFKQSVLTSRLCCVILADKRIITTVDHLFFTNNGWTKAIDLQEGDTVYANNVSKDVFELWKGISSNTEPQRGQVLLSSLFSGISKEDTHPEDETSIVCDMWKTDDLTNILSNSDLFRAMQGKTDITVRKTNNEYRIWDDAKETIIRKNVEEQSNDAFSEYSENVSDQREERHFTRSIQDQSGWEWEVHDSTDSLIRSLRGWLGIGVSNIYEKSNRNGCTLVLQSRPRLSKNETCRRSGWQRAQIENQLITGCKENRVLDEVRVDSVEIYQRGCNDELFRDCFTYSELSDEYVTMYDLEVENDHAYFANGVLVHNCHMFSEAAWNAMLKLLEEPPKTAIFIFCTTDPQKIPKTILSRVQRYDFQRISQEGIVNRLHDILVSEQQEDYYNSGKVSEITYKGEALEYIAKLAEGGMRDAITMLEKCLAFSTELTLENVVKTIGTVNYDTFFLLTDSLVHKKPSDMMQIIEDVHAQGKDLKLFIRTYIDFILDLCKYHVMDSRNYIRIPDYYEIEQLSDFYFDGCARVLKNVINLNANIKWDNNPKTMIEAYLYEMCLGEE